MENIESRSPAVERLMDVSERLFAERGFSGTSVRDITAEAGCNVAAVNYYFGGKENLYREMFRRRLRALRDRRLAAIQNALNGSGRPAGLENFLQAFAESFVEPLVAEGGDRFYFSLITRELLDPHLPPDFLTNEMFQPIERAWIMGLATFC